SGRDTLAFFGSPLSVAMTPASRTGGGGGLGGIGVVVVLAAGRGQERVASHVQVWSSGKGGERSLTQGLSLSLGTDRDSAAEQALSATLTPDLARLFPQYTAQRKALDRTHTGMRSLGPSTTYAAPSLSVMHASSGGQAEGMGMGHTQLMGTGYGDDSAAWAVSLVPRSFTLPPSDTPFHSVCLSPGSGLLVCASAEGICVVEPHTGRQVGSRSATHRSESGPGRSLHSLSLPVPGCVTCLGVLSDELVAYGTDLGGVGVLEVVTLETVLDIAPQTQFRQTVGCGGTAADEPSPIIWVQGHIRPTPIVSLLSEDGLLLVIDVNQAQVVGYCTAVPGGEGPLPGGASPIPLRLGHETHCIHPLSIPSTGAPSLCSVSMHAQRTLLSSCQPLSLAVPLATGGMALSSMGGGSQSLFHPPPSLTCVCAARDGSNRVAGAAGLSDGQVVLFDSDVQVVSRTLVGGAQSIGVKAMGFVGDTLVVSTANAATFILSIPSLSVLSAHNTEGRHASGAEGWGHVQAIGRHVLMCTDHVMMVASIGPLTPLHIRTPPLPHLDSAPTLLQSSRGSADVLYICGGYGPDVERGHAVRMGVCPLAIPSLAPLSHPIPLPLLSPRTSDVGAGSSPSTRHLCCVESSGLYLAVAGVSPSAIAAPSLLPSSRASSVSVVDCVYSVLILETMTGRVVDCISGLPRVTLVAFDGEEGGSLSGVLHVTCTGGSVLCFRANQGVLANMKGRGLWGVRSVASVLDWSQAQGTQALPGTVSRVGGSLPLVPQSLPLSLPQSRNMEGVQTQSRHVYSAPSPAAIPVQQTQAGLSTRVQMVPLASEAESAPMPADSVPAVKRVVFEGDEKPPLPPSPSHSYLTAERFHPLGQTMPPGGVAGLGSGALPATGGVQTSPADASLFSVLESHKETEGQGQGPRKVTYPVEYAAEREAVPASIRRPPTLETAGERGGEGLGVSELGVVSEAAPPVVPNSIHVGFHPQARQGMSAGQVSGQEWVGGPPPPGYGESRPVSGRGRIEREASVGLDEYESLKTSGFASLDQFDSTIGRIQVDTIQREVEETLGSMVNIVAQSNPTT
ncbi:hypothetical protein KIPB_010111, partial [Kipferlia bialata]